MNIAVLSGKGGAGKTFFSANLARVAKDSNYIDCDIEEPNGHLFFKPDIVKSENVYIEIPEYDESLCSGCRDCIEFCKFNALAFVNNKVIVFDKICHSCKGCIIFCPDGALSGKKKIIGNIEFGKSENVNIITGILNVGEESGVPIIKKQLTYLKNEKINIIDCPPGSACTVIESVRESDYCVLVGEDSIFGYNNLVMVAELVKIFKKPFSIVINKYMDKNSILEKYSEDNNIKILEKIPFDSIISKYNSNGEIIVDKNDKYKKIFLDVLKNIVLEVQK